MSACPCVVLLCGVMFARCVTIFNCTRRVKTSLESPKSSCGSITLVMRIGSGCLLSVARSSAVMCHPSIMRHHTTVLSASKANPAATSHKSSCGSTTMVMGIGSDASLPSAWLGHQDVVSYVNVRAPLHIQLQLPKSSCGSTTLVFTKGYTETSGAARLPHRQLPGRRGMDCGSSKLHPSSCQPIFGNMKSHTFTHHLVVPFFNPLVASKP